jgi:hypothetical protein
MLQIIFSEHCPCLWKNPGFHLYHTLKAICSDNLTNFGVLHRRINSFKMFIQQLLTIQQHLTNSKFSRLLSNTTIRNVTTLTLLAMFVMWLDTSLAEAAMLECWTELNTKNYMDCLLKAYRCWAFLAFLAVCILF